MHHKSVLLSNFKTLKLLLVTEKPTLVSADVSIVDKNLSFSNASYASGKSSRLFVYTSLAPDECSVSLTGQYNGPKSGSGTFTNTRFLTDYRNYTAPPWVSSQLVGIVAVSLKMTLATSTGSLL